MTKLYRITVRYLWETYAIILSARDEDEAVGKAKEHIKKGRITNVERLERECHTN